MLDGSETKLSNGRNKDSWRRTGVHPSLLEGGGGEEEGICRRKREKKQKTFEATDDEETKEEVLKGRSGSCPEKD